MLCVVTFSGAAQTRRRVAAVAELTVNSLLKKPPGEGTGPTIHVDFQADPVGRVPSRGNQDVFDQVVKRRKPFMRAHRNRWLLLAVVLAALLILLLRPSSTKPHEVRVSFVTYTNVPGSSIRFALFSLINYDWVSIRHRGISVEMEGDSMYKAPVTRPGLPWITATPVG